MLAGRLWAHGLFLPGAEQPALLGMVRSWASVYNGAHQAGDPLFQREPVSPSSP
jgi:hypothetical protein